MPEEARPVYLFRAAFGHGSEAVVCAAPLDLAVAVYGGGGRHDQEGVRQAFGGNAFYRDDETGARFIAVWGARNASRFRSALRRAAPLVIIREPPPARLLWWTQLDQRPPPSAQGGVG